MMNEKLQCSSFKMLFVVHMNDHVIGKQGSYRGSGSTRPEDKSAREPTRPESTRPGVFSERSATYMVYGLFCTCIIFQTKSKININQLCINIAIKLLIDRIGGELVI